MSAAAPLSVSARIGRLLAIVIVFVVLGPPIGALVLVGLVEGIGGYGEFDSSDRHWLTLLDLIAAVPVSYWYGTGPAALAALAIGIRQSFFGRATWPMALAVGLLVAIVVLDRSGGYPFGGRPTDQPFPASSAIVMLACTAATMLCWGLVRHWYVSPPAAPAERSMESAP